MSYPPAPWLLQGYAFQTLQLVETDKVKPLIPSEVDVFSVVPHYTVAGIYLSAYQSGSVLEYSELIVVPGLVRYAGRVGAWISHIYVDSPDSVMGGREIWGLPKEMAEFQWSRGDRTHLTVRQGDRLLCQFRSDWRLPLWRQGLTGNAFSILGLDLLMFEAKAEANPAVVGAHLTIPPTSPFAGLNLDQPWVTVAGESLRLLVGQPKTVG